MPQGLGVTACPESFQVSTATFSGPSAGRRPQTHLMGKLRHYRLKAGFGPRLSIATMHTDHLGLWKIPAWSRVGPETLHVASSQGCWSAGPTEQGGASTRAPALPSTESPPPGQASGDRGTPGDKGALEDTKKWPAQWATAGFCFGVWLGFQRLKGLELTTLGVYCTRSQGPLP